MKIDFEKLYELMQAFYSLTSIKIIIFDEEHRIVCSYPAEDCDFCKMMKHFPHTSQKCTDNDLKVFNECKKSGKLMLYNCHAGLVEGCAPLKQNDTVIGYIMFGQISDLPDRDALFQNIATVCCKNELKKKDFLKAAKSIKLKTYDNIMAATKIFEACISYIILNEMLMPEQDKMMIESEKYIENNLHEVTVESLYRHLNVSRTALYDLFQKKTGQGVAAFIRTKQFEKAKQLLKESDIPIKDIASICGFYDYNYFSRVFKKRYGISPRTIRKS